MDAFYLTPRSPARTEAMALKLHCSTTIFLQTHCWQAPSELPVIPLQLLCCHVKPSLLPWHVAGWNTCYQTADEQLKMFIFRWLFCVIIITLTCYHYVPIKWSNELCYFQAAYPFAKISIKRGTTTIRDGGIIIGIVNLLLLGLQGIMLIHSSEWQKEWHYILLFNWTQKVSK